MAGNIRLLVYSGLQLHRTKNQPVLRQRVDQQIAITLPVAARGQPADHIVLSGGGKGHHQQELFPLFSRQFDDDIIGLHHLRLATVDFVGNLPEILLVVKDLDILHVVAAVEHRLVFEHILRVAEMRPQILGHLF